MNELYLKTIKTIINELKNTSKERLTIVECNVYQ